MNNETKISEILGRIRQLVDSKRAENNLSIVKRDTVLLQICEMIAELKGYDWVGFYLVDPTDPTMLVLGPYVGEPTEHVKIRFGQGICGQAAELEKTFVVEDVSQEDNYLACSIHVKSEIVVPIFRNGKIVGEIDVDSHQLANFSKIDQEFLEEVAELVSFLI